MARIREEAALVREGSLDAREHVVQARAELRDLVARRGNRKPAIVAAEGDRRRLPPHPLDRPQRRGGERIARERREQEGARAPEQQLGDEVVEGLLAGLERSRDDGDGRLAPRGDGGGQEPPAPLAEAGQRRPRERDRTAPRAGELGAREQQRMPRHDRRAKHAAAGSEQLGDPFPARELVRIRRARSQGEGGDVVGAGTEVPVE